MKKFFCALSMFIYFSVLGQSFIYRNYNYQWEEPSPAVIPVDSMFTDADAVILDEKVNYNAGGNITPDELSPVVSKHIRIKYLTQEGIDKHSTFILPESFDPQSDCYSVRYDG